MSGPTTRANSRHTILFAEDSDNDALLIQRGFQKARFPFELQFVENGLVAVDYLNGKGSYADRSQYPLPCVLLTDLKMPRMCGFELLSWIRSQPAWRKLPVIVVTGSDQTQDCQRAMELGADAYVVKELLMRPPPALFDAILRCLQPPSEDARKAWAQRIHRNFVR